MKTIFAIIVISLSASFSFADGNNIQTPLTSQIQEEHDKDTETLSPGLDKDIVILKTGSSLELESAEICTQCSDTGTPSSSSSDH